MADKLTVLRTFVEGKLALVEAEEKEIAQVVNDDFNPMDASGGNFDDAYGLGERHGENHGEFLVLTAIKEILDGEDE